MSPPRTLAALLAMVVKAVAVLVAALSAGTGARTGCAGRDGAASSGGGNGENDSPG